MASNTLNNNVFPTVNSPRWLDITDFDGEKWVDIQGFQGKYQISNYGRVKSKERERKAINGNGTMLLKAQIMKEHVVKKEGDYLYVSLYKENAKTSSKVFVHRLVADAFLQNIDNLPQVNHKDENKQNNHVDNLEWCSCLYNIRYGTGMERAEKKRIELGINNKVGMFDKDGNLIKVFPSQNKAAKECHFHGRKLRNEKGAIGFYKDGYFYKVIA